MTSDQLQLTISAVPLVSLQAIGTLHGVRITAVAGLNGPGAGLLSIDADGLVVWSPPGGAEGAAVDVTAGGSFTIFGADPNQWISISVEADYLALASQASVVLQDIYDGPLVGTDCTAAQAAAGNVQSWSVTLHNTSASRMIDVLVWLAEDATHWQLSADNATWSAPDSSHFLPLPPIAAAGSGILYIRRSIVAGELSQAELLLLVHLEWAG